MSRIVDCPGCKQKAEGYDSKNIKYCKSCWREYGRRWRKAHMPQAAGYMAAYRAKNPEKLRAINRKCWDKNKDKYNHSRKFGGPSLFDALCVAQGGVCAICKQPEKSNRYKTLSVDHCHKTEKIRGLLCSHCNRALGLFGEDVEVLGAAIQYLQRGD